ncbi:MAG: adenylate/guanylate cyclase domain-containing protein [Magnetococcales bacterium]|nr:adenylate/guanylate cyclase domain-containing protein [Magnetococcales bacterium]
MTHAPLIRTLLISLCLAWLGWGIWWMSAESAPIRQLEYWMHDGLFWLRGATPVSGQVVIVAIDEASSTELGHAWPWPRSLHARLIKTLNLAGARLIFFDVIFAKPAKDPTEDQQLAAAMQESVPVILASGIAQTHRPTHVEASWLEPTPLLRHAAHATGAAIFLPDGDGVIRTYPDQMEGRISLGQLFASLISPNPSRVSSLIDYHGPMGTLPAVSYYQALNWHTDLPKGYFQNKVVLVGHMNNIPVALGSGTDSFPTPFFRFDGQRMHGVEIHGHLFETILNPNPLRNWSPGPWIVPVLWIWLVTLRGEWAANHPGLVLILFVGFLMMVSAGIYTLFVQYRILCTVGFPITLLTLGTMGWSLHGHVTTLRKKKVLKKIFGNYIAPALVERLLRQPELVRLGGEVKEISVLFSDIRGFTGLSEALPGPEALVTFLNHYLNAMTAPVLTHQGMIDKYIGDAIMALFGAPLDDPHHARSACLAALAMVEALPAVNHHFLTSWPSATSGIQIGIGIHTGEVVVGNMGSRQRFDYTVIGDNVNLASRLEGLTKEYGVHIIISATTREQLDARFICRELDMVRVKGKNQPVKIYQLITCGTASGEFSWLESHYARAVTAYRAGDWEHAAGILEQILQRAPEDGPTRLLHTRCNRLLAHPPETWDGVWTMTAK